VYQAWHVLVSPNRHDRVVRGAAHRKLDACVRFRMLARDARRRQRSDVRSSMALETLVAEDCDRCGNCALACPQVDPTIKHYLVQTHLAEGMAELLAKASTEEAFTLDLLLSN
jgi:ferredoxin